MSENTTTTWSTERHERERLHTRRCRVSVVDGPDSGHVAVSESGRIRIGAHRGCQLRLSDPAVSRFHCELIAGAYGYELRDCGSANGTYVAEARVERAVLTRPCTIRVGNSVLRFDLLDDFESDTLPNRTRLVNLIGASRAMRSLYRQIAGVARTDCTVLVTGESGTGKELVAEAVHELSERAERPFVVVDCSAISDGLVASELFGHVRGAFTGASTDRVGAFERASGGTVFLDEIGELPPEQQTHLLGVLERRAVRRVGTTDLVPVDVRVVAATNRDLPGLVNRGLFREDLYYRIAVAELRTPALRERPEDISLLAEHFWRQLQGPKGHLPLDSIRRLESDSFPGNVRQLRNAVSRLSIDLEPFVAAESTPSTRVDTSVPYLSARAAAMRSFDRDYLLQAIREHGGNVAAAAKASGVGRMTFHKRLTRLGLRHLLQELR